MKVIWNLTKLCSWNCVICCVSAVHVCNDNKEEIFERLVNKGKELKLLDKMKIVDQLYDNNVESIDFSGGDLLIRDDDIKLIEYAASKFNKSQLSISIPGNRLTVEKINKLKKYVSKIEFTLDSITYDIDSSRPSGYVETAINAIKLCNNEGIDTCVSTVLKKHNCNKKTINELYNFLISNNVKEWEILRYYQVGRATDLYAYKPDEEKVLKIVDYIKTLMDNKEINISFQHTLENQINGFVKCNALKNSIGILPDGTVTACAWGLDRNGMPIDESFIVGKLPKEKLSDILSNNKALKWKDKIKNNGCDKCMVDEFLNNI